MLSVWEWSEYIDIRSASAVEVLNTKSVDDKAEADDSSNGVIVATIEVHKKEEEEAILEGEDDVIISEVRDSRNDAEVFDGSLCRRHAGDGEESGRSNVLQADR